MGTGLPRNSQVGPGHRAPGPRSVPPRDAEPDLGDPSFYLNRELSRLSFNRRVLAQARDVGHPLRDRVRFLAIAAGNLDEFYMVPLASILREHRAGVEAVSLDGLDLGEQARAVRNAADAMLHDLESCWTEQLQPELATHGIQLLDAEEYTPEVARYLSDRFSSTICPVLTPLAFDPGHPFPYMPNRSKNLAVVVGQRRRMRFARVNVPESFPRFIELPRHLAARHTYVYLEDVILQNLQELFPGIPVVSAHLFRIIRDTDLVLREDQREDLRDLVDRGLREVRHGAISLLQVDHKMPKRVLDILVDNFEVDEDTAVRSSGRMGYADWQELARLVPRVAREPRAVVPRTLWRTGDEHLLFNRIKYQDFLVHHPFDSFSAVETFLEAAVADPQVAAIKMTLYRIGEDSPLIDLLIRAAEAGIEVAVLVELKARFDERSNIEWASRLERAGVHVVHGLVHLKTHCKICLVVRHAGDTVERYAHIATGNYNRVTAMAYTDIGMFTSDPRIVADLSELFNYLTGYSDQTEYRELLVAPVNLRQRFVALFEREAEHARAGRPAGIILKVNSFSDGDIIRHLYETSRAGVPIDLIVRGICCLRPGVPGVSDRITVRSIIGRFLEHSRIWYFENGGDAEVYLGSADLMDRNLNRRVETMCPVRDAGLARYLRETVLDAYLKDTGNAWVLGADGEYTRMTPTSEPFIAQDYLLEHAPPVGVFEIVDASEVVTPESAEDEPPSDPDATPSHRRRRRPPSSLRS